MIDFSSLPADCAYTSFDGQQWARVTISETETDRLIREFDFVDAKGRRIGGRVILRVETRELHPVADPKGYSRLSKWVGSRFTAEPHALRDGERFGASQATHYFETEGERDAYVAKYFRDAEKRAAKQGRPA